MPAHGRAGNNVKSAKRSAFSPTPLVFRDGANMDVDRILRAVLDNPELLTATDNENTKRLEEIVQMRGIPLKMTAGALALKLSSYIGSLFRQSQVIKSKAILLVVIKNLLTFCESIRESHLSSELISRLLSLIYAAAGMVYKLSYNKLDIYTLDGSENDPFTWFDLFAEFSCLSIIPESQSDVEVVNLRLHIEAISVKSLIESPQILKQAKKIAEMRNSVLERCLENSKNIPNIGQAVDMMCDNCVFSMRVELFNGISSLVKGSTTQLDFISILRTYLSSQKKLLYLTNGTHVVHNSIPWDKICSIKLYDDHPTDDITKYLEDMKVRGKKFECSLLYESFEKRIGSTNKNNALVEKWSIQSLLRFRSKVSSSKDTQLYSQMYTTCLEKLSLFKRTFKPSKGQSTMIIEELKMYLVNTTKHMAENNAVLSAITSTFAFLILSLYAEYETRVQYGSAASNVLEVWKYLLASEQDTLKLSFKDLKFFIFTLCDGFRVNLGSTLALDLLTHVSLYCDKKGLDQTDIIFRIISEMYQSGYSEDAHFKLTESLKDGKIVVESSRAEFELKFLECTLACTLENLEPVEGSIIQFICSTTNVEPMVNPLIAEAMTLVFKSKEKYIAEDYEMSIHLITEALNILIKNRSSILHDNRDVSVFFRGSHDFYVSEIYDMFILDCCAWIATVYDFRGQFKSMRHYIKYGAEICSLGNLTFLRDIFATMLTLLDMRIGLQVENSKLLTSVFEDIETSSYLIDPLYLSLIATGMYQAGRVTFDSKLISSSIHKLKYLSEKPSMLENLMPKIADKNLINVFVKGRLANFNRNKEFQSNGLLEETRMVPYRSSSMPLFSDALLLAVLEGTKQQLNKIQTMLDNKVKVKSSIHLGTDIFAVDSIHEGRHAFEDEKLALETLWNCCSSNMDSVLKSGVYSLVVGWIDLVLALYFTSESVLLESELEHRVRCLFSDIKDSAIEENIVDSPKEVLMAALINCKLCTMLKREDLQSTNRIFDIFTFMKNLPTNRAICLTTADKLRDTVCVCRVSSKIVIEDGAVNVVPFSSLVMIKSTAFSRFSMNEAMKNTRNIIKDSVDATPFQQFMDQAMKEQEEENKKCFEVDSDLVINVEEERRLIDLKAKLMWWKRKDELDISLCDSLTVIENGLHLKGLIGSFILPSMEMQPDFSVLDSIRQTGAIDESLFENSDLKNWYASQDHLIRGFIGKVNSALGESGIDVTLVDVLNARLFWRQALDGHWEASPERATRIADETIQLIEEKYLGMNQAKMTSVIHENIKNEIVSLILEYRSNMMDIPFMRGVRTSRKTEIRLDEDNNVFLDATSGSKDMKAVSILNETEQLMPTSFCQDVILILDKVLIGLPIESMKVFNNTQTSKKGYRHGSICRNLCLELLEIAETCEEAASSIDCTNVSSGFYMLNPGGDLAKTQERFETAFNQGRDMEQEIKWRGFIQKEPQSITTDDLKNPSVKFDDPFLRECIVESDLFLYFGHGGGEQYLNGRLLSQTSQTGANEEVATSEVQIISKQRGNLPKTMLFGCSSCRVAENGEFDISGTVINYLKGNADFVVGCLWDVTDGDLDRFAKELLDKFGALEDGAGSVKSDADVNGVVHMKESVSSKSQIEIIREGNVGHGTSASELEQILDAFESPLKSKKRRNSRLSKIMPRNSKSGSVLRGTKQGKLMDIRSQGEKLRWADSDTESTKSSLSSSGFMSQSTSLSSLNSLSSSSYSLVSSDLDCRREIDIGRAVMQCRKVCRLPNITGGAVVVFKGVI